jgi:hypothetical protein
MLNGQHAFMRTASPEKKQLAIWPVRRETLVVVPLFRGCGGELFRGPMSGKTGGLEMTFFCPEILFRKVRNRVVFRASSPPSCMTRRTSCLPLVSKTASPPCQRHAGRATFKTPQTVCACFLVLQVNAGMSNLKSNFFVSNDKNALCF